MSIDNGHRGAFEDEECYNQAPQCSVSDNHATVKGTDNPGFSCTARTPQQQQQQPLVQGETTNETRRIEPGGPIQTQSGSQMPRNAFTIPTGGVDTGRSMSYRLPYHMQRDFYLQGLFGGVKDPVFVGGFSAILEKPQGVDNGSSQTLGRVVNVISPLPTPATEMPSIYAGLHPIQSCRSTPTERQNPTETSSTDTMVAIPMQPLGRQLQSRNLLLVENGSVVASCQVSATPRRPIESWGCCGILSRSPFSLALFTCLCCCLPIGAVAVLFATMSLFSKASGDTDAHTKFASTSVVLSFVGIASGGLMTAGYIIGTVIVVVG